MENDFAYAKLQSMTGEEIFIKRIPVILSNSEGQSIYDNKILRSIDIIRCPSLPKQLGILYYENDMFRYLSSVKTIVDEREILGDRVAQEVLDKVEVLRSLKAFEPYTSEYSLPLESMCRIHIPCSSCQLPHFFYFLLPLREPIPSLSKTTPLQNYTPSRNPLNPFSKLPDRSVYQRWGQEDRDLLKKILLQFGYGRLGVVLRQAGVRFTSKSRGEVRAFSNAFIRSLIDLIQGQHPELRQFLLNMVEETPEDLYIEPNIRDWDLQNLKQKLVSVAKRIQLMSRIRMFIKKFKEDQLERMGTRDKSLINWEQLLNFLPSQSMYSQRPAIWWTRKYDCDLLVGVYKYGYTNYNAIRQAPDLGFAELDKSNIQYIYIQQIQTVAALYQEFPVPDTLNKRVKKLIQVILKHETDNGKIDFGNTLLSDEEIDSSWAPEERQALFDLLCDYGVPIAPDGRQSWQDLRDHLNSLKKKEKSLGQLERMVQNIRITCQHMLVRARGTKAEVRSVAADYSNSQSMSSEEHEHEQDDVNTIEPNNINEPVEIVNETSLNNPKSINGNVLIIEPINNLFEISLDDALRFSKNTNLLHFIRKQVNPSASILFSIHQEELNRCLGLMEKDDPILINDQFNLKDDDMLINLYIYKQYRALLQIVSQIGLSALNDLTQHSQFSHFSIPIDSSKAMARIEWLCSFFKNIRDQQNLKRKSEYNLKDDVGKRVKVSTAEKDPFSGELILPMQVNASLKLFSLGHIVPSSLYHSEHNLFPVGYKSIRTYASMFNRGQRCQYTCEIQEASDGKPVFKVTSEEDVDNPIVRNSCTGCWVYICQKVNELQEHKKQKVTISGTDRFGLLEPNVARYLEELPNAEKCQKYKFKYRTDFINQQRVYH